MSLPRYYEVLQRDFVSRRASCPCGMGAAHRTHSDPDGGELQRLDRVVSSDSATSSAENRSTERNAEPPVRTLVGRSTQYERLISGMESEVGEAPPAYESVSGALPVFRSQMERF